MFLSVDELVELTGRRIKGKQIDALRRMGVPFFVNALGKPVVARQSVEGVGRISVVTASSVSWVPRAMGR